MPMPPTCRTRPIARAADAVRAVKGGYSGQLCGGAGAHQRPALRRREPARRPDLRNQGQAAGDIDAYARAKDPRVRQVTVSFGASWQVVEILRADGDSYRDVRPLVRVNVSVVVGDGDAPGNRQLRLRRPRRLSTAFLDENALAARRRRGGASGAGQSRSGARAGRRDGCRARPRLAGRDAARSGRPRPRRRFQPQEDLGLRRPDGPAGRGQGRHRGRRRHACRRAAARSRSTTKARRPAAPC